MTLHGKAAHDPDHAAEVTHPDLAAAFAGAPERTLVAGETLFRQGDPVTHAHLVVDGSLALVRHSSTGRRMVLHRASAGELSADGSIYAPSYGCDGESERVLTIRIMPMGTMRALLAERPELAGVMLRTAMRRLHTARALLELHNIRSAEDRTFEHLSLLARGGIVQIEGRLRDLAAEIGLSPEAHYRALAGLERAGRIRRSPGAIEVIGVAGPVPR